jgi:hypothetical protein
MRVSSQPQQHFRLDLTTGTITYAHRQTSSPPSHHRRRRHPAPAPHPGHGLPHRRRPHLGAEFACAQCADEPVPVDDWVSVMFFFFTEVDIRCWMFGVGCGCRCFVHCCHDHQQSAIRQCCLHMRIHAYTHICFHHPASCVSDPNCSYIRLTRPLPTASSRS